MAEDRFSEFTYGFSLVSEMAKTLGCHVAPIFPSLYQEGKKGGFDVKLDQAGLPLYLQFKLSHFLKTNGAKELKKAPHILSKPYYRFGITSASVSKQHSMLLGLAQDERTFYCAPKFHTVERLNKYWSTRSVVENSVFIDPVEIGPILDGKPHSVCFDENSLKNGCAYLFSEPKKIQLKDPATLKDQLAADLEKAEAAVGDCSQRWLGSLNSAIMYGEDLERKAAIERQTRKADRRMQGVPTDVEQVPSLERRKEREVVGGTEPQLPREVDKPSIRISAEWENLFQMSELAINHMNAQLYILQHK